MKNRDSHAAHRRAGNALAVLAVLHLVVLLYAACFLATPQQRSVWNLSMGGGLNVVLMTLVILLALRIRKGKWVLGGLAVSLFLAVGGVVRIGFVSRALGLSWYALPDLVYIAWCMLTATLLGQIEFEATGTSDEAE